MEFRYIIFEVEQGIATLTLNRSEENSLNFDMLEEMAQAIELCAGNPKVRVVVLTGAGGVFSTGYDMETLNRAREMLPTEAAELIEKQGCSRLVKMLMSLPKPVIACVNGLCYGAGGELAMACDYILASNKASFGQPYISVGLMGNSYLLPRLVGTRKALELIWTGKIISAEEAYQIGIVNAVVVAGSLVESTYKLARSFAQGPTLAMGMAKKAVYESAHMDIEKGLKLIYKMQIELMKSKDHQEGVAAYLEKRKPVFTGE